MKKMIMAVMFTLMMLPAMAQTVPVVYRIKAESFKTLPKYVKVPKGYVLTKLSSGWAIISNVGTWDWSKAKKMRRRIRRKGFGAAEIYQSSEDKHKLI